MALKDIFTMVKADRYTQDGREEIIKAQEEVEDVRYNIGDISQKTGLMKTANGWVEPPKGKAKGAKTGAGKSPDKQLAKEIENGDHFERQKKEAAKRKREEALKADRREGEARADDFRRKVESGEIVYNKKTGKFEDGKKSESKSTGSKLDEKKAALKEIESMIDNAGDYDDIEEMEKERQKLIKEIKKEEKSAPAKTESKPSAPKALKLPDEKSSFQTDVNRMKKLKKEDYKQYTVQLEKLHSKYPINKWKDLLAKTTSDAAPRVLTGDCKIRIKK